MNKKTTLAIYSGRFQPFHPGHHGVYKKLVKEFGKDNVYIVSSNVTNQDSSPFDFKQKEVIIHKLFKIPKEQIVMVRNPYNPEELLNDFDPEITSVVFAIGKKDSNRLSGGNIEVYKNQRDLVSMNEKLYAWYIDPQADGINASFIRTFFETNNDPEKLKDFFIDFYGTFNQQVFDIFLRELTD